MNNQGDFPGAPGPDSAMNRRIAERQAREDAARENPDVQRGLEQAKKGELTDGPRVDRRSGEDRRSTPAPNVPSPDHLGELMALAATIRQCQRNGHPDLGKHLEALLTKLGA